MYRNTTRKNIFVFFIDSAVSYFYGKWFLQTKFLDLSHFRFSWTFLLLCFISYKDAFKGKLFEILKFCILCILMSLLSICVTVNKVHISYVLIWSANLFFFFLFLKNGGSVVKLQFVRRYGILIPVLSLFSCWRQLPPSNNLSSFEERSCRRLDWKKRNRKCVVVLYFTKDKQYNRLFYWSRHQVLNTYFGLLLLIVIIFPCKIQRDRQFKHINFDCSFVINFWRIPVWINFLYIYCVLMIKYCFYMLFT